MPAASLPNVYANMSPEEKASFKRQILDGQKFSLWNKYHSRVRLQSVLTEGASAYNYTFTAGTELRAFSYAIGQEMQGVGFPSGYVAQPNDTNLIKGSETISGENVLIYGLSCLLDSDTDAQLAQVVAPNVSVTVALNGDQNSYRMGNVQLVPGGGGLYGFGQSNVEVPALNSSVTNISGALANGLPSADNFYAFPQPILWTASGRADSTLIVKLRVEHTCTYQTTQKDRVADTGIAGWTHPTPPERGTYVGFSVHLFSRQISPRSQNS